MKSGIEVPELGVGSWNGGWGLGSSCGGSIQLWGSQNPLTPWLGSRSDHAEGGQHHPPAERLQLGSSLENSGCARGGAPHVPLGILFCSFNSWGNKKKITFFTKSGNGVSVSGGESFSRGFSMWDWILELQVFPNQALYPQINPFFPKSISFFFFPPKQIPFSPKKSLFPKAIPYSQK